MLIYIMCNVTNLNRKFWIFQKFNFTVILYQMFFFLPGHIIFEENDQSLVKHVPALKDRAWLPLFEQDKNGTSYSLVCPNFRRNQPCLIKKKNHTSTVCFFLIQRTKPLSDSFKNRIFTMLFPNSVSVDRRPSLRKLADKLYIAYFKH